MAEAPVGAFLRHFSRVGHLALRDSVHAVNAAQILWGFFNRSTRLEFRLLIFEDPNSHKIIYSLLQAILALTDPGMGRSRSGSSPTNPKDDQVEYGHRHAKVQYHRFQSSELRNVTLRQAMP